jgi:tetratricopeptide (TPR) repeat protein
MPADPCQEQLAAAVAAITRDDLDTAGNILRDILVVHVQHPVAHYLLGRVALERGAWRQAEAHLRQALAIAPDRPEILLHLVQSLRAQQRAAEALPYCHQALALAPDDPGAELELARLQEETGATAEAEASYRRILARHDVPTALVNLSEILCSAGRADEAERMLRQGLENPRLEDASRGGLEYQLARALKRQRRYEPALQLLRALPANAREKLLDHADLLQHMGRVEEAAALYQKRLDEEPLDMGVHVLLSEIRRGMSDDALASFDAALALRPGAPQLPIQKGQLLLKMGRAADAESAFQTALRIAPGHAEALQGLGKALEALHDADGARAAHAAGLAAAPGNGAVLENHAAFLLRQGEALLAEPLAQKAWALNPNSQAALALLGLCWRTSSVAREEWLNDYQGHVQIFDLEAPPGYRDMESFNAELAHYLGELHSGAREYLTQTLRGGSQTHENIFYNGHPLVDRLVPRISAAVRSYVESLKDRGDHPFTARRGKGFRYTGSWSSRLGSNGFHVNHVHNHGWISSCYYVAVPDAISDGQQGWIKFGEPSGEYNLGLAPRRTIEPRPGRLVLFPSYMWHGTVPFLSADPRVTIAFDVIPA